MIELENSSLFEAAFYTRHDHRRLEHLATLGLDLHDKSVLEPGAGIGQHSLFYADRKCVVTSYEPRADNCALFRKTMENSWSPHTGQIKLVQASYQHIADIDEMFDIVHCYGFLYHVGSPSEALAILAARTSGLMVLETCVSMGDALDANIVDEPVANPAQAFDGKGCRPTRPWVMQELRKNFAHVYVTRTQPFHDEFPTDWTKPWPNKSGLVRSVFVASRERLDNSNLLTTLPDTQPNV